MPNVEIKKFFADMYFDRYGSILALEVREEVRICQMVSNLFEKEAAQNLHRQLSDLFPPKLSSNIAIFESRQKHGQYRVVIRKPDEMYGHFMQAVIEVLKIRAPLPLVEMPSQNPNIPLYRWLLWPERPIIGFGTNLSSYLLPGNQSPSYTEDKQKLSDFITRLEVLFRGVKVKSKIHKNGDEYYIDRVDFEAYQKLIARQDNVLNLSESVMFFFKKNPQALAHQDLKKLPLAEINELEARDIQPNNPQKPKFF